MEGLPLLKHAMKEKVLMITIDLKVLAFVCQWVNSINPFLGSFLFFNSLLSTFSPYFIHKATEQKSLMGGGGGGGWDYSLSSNFTGRRVCFVFCQF